MGIDEQRREAVERLRALKLEGGSHEMLSAIARAVMPDAGAWTVGACRGLRDRLVALIGRGDEWARGESITEKLREYAKDWGWLDMSAEDAQERLEAIADYIDAEHEKAMAAAALIAGVPITDENMAQYGWVRLPKDADGEYIHIGDVMEWIDLEGKVSVTCVVEAVGVDAFIAWDKANGRYAQKCATAYRHYQPPTVEDVLTEFGIDWEYESDGEDRAALLAEYAAKLRLAGDAE